MTKARFLFFPFAIAILLIVAASGAKAQSTAIVTENNNCLIPDGSRFVRVFKCSDGGIRYTINRGYIRTSDNYCFDHGVVRGSNPSNDQRAVKLVPCREGNQSQVWYVITSGRGTGLIQNAVNPDVCLNIEGGADRPGSRVLVWPCGFNNPAANERFYIGGPMSSSQVSMLPQAARTAVSSGGTVTFNNGARIVAAGAGNIVAAGAGNIVAQGAGNIVAQGAGNIVAQGAGNLINTSAIANGVSSSVSGVGFRVN